MKKLPDNPEELMNEILKLRRRNKLLTKVISEMSDSIAKLTELLGKQETVENN